MIIACRLQIHGTRCELIWSTAYLTSQEEIEGQRGGYLKDVFMGHCSENGQNGYLPIVASKEVIAIEAEKLWNQGY